MSLEYASGKLDAMREAILGDVDYCIPIISVKSFQKHLLPPLKNGITVNDVVSALKHSGTVSSTGDRTWWKDFIVSPSKQKNKEDDVFAPLEGICEEVVRLAASASGQQETFILRLLPNSTPNSGRASTHRPDAYFIDKTAEDAAEGSEVPQRRVRLWYDIALTGEFKKRMSIGDRNKVRFFLAPDF